MNCKKEFQGLFKAIRNHSRDVNQFPLIVHFSVKDILDLPVRQSPWSGQKYAQRTPVTILRALDLTCTCTDVAFWTFPDYPNITITDYATRQALNYARTTTPSQLSEWHTSVAAGDDVALCAFDYTADFHSRDMDTKPRDHQGEDDIIDLGPFGKGYWTFDGESMDDFSVTFAQDMQANMEYFAKVPWTKGLYDVARREERIVECPLGRPVDWGEVTSIKVRRQPASNLGKR